MKNYLIIGGSSGIGLATVELLLETENHVYTSYFSKEKPDNKANYFHLNVLDENLDLSFLPETLDGLVYCPGNINLKPFGRFKPQDFVEDYQLQVVGAVKVIQAVLPRLKKADFASIVLFSTVAVQTGFGFHSLVSASKGALEGLTRALAAELAPSIRVNCIAPSITQTPLAANILNTPEKIETNAQRHPLKKIGSPDDIAKAAVFLLTDQSSWITGQILHVDGGISNLKS